MLVRLTTVVSYVRSENDKKNIKNAFFFSDIHLEHMEQLRLTV